MPYGDRRLRLHFNRLTILFAIMLLISSMQTIQGKAYAEPGVQDTTNALAETERMIQQLDSGSIEQGSESFSAVKKWWNANKAEAKRQSLDMALEIDGKIAALSLSFVIKDSKQAATHASDLRFSLQMYAEGAFVMNDGKTNLSLGTYVLKLRQTGDLIDRGELEQARSETKLLQRQWLTVEGDVVSQSQSVYSDSERDLVMLDAYLSGEGKPEEASMVVDRMIRSLSPLIDAQYSWWDAALIPIREGIEALLVVGTLLMFAKKSNSKPAQRWVAYGTMAGVALSIVVGFGVALLLSSSAFGRNNALINGWTGVFASLMLLYVSYWLHRNSDVKRWNGLIKTKSDMAISGGKMLSLALIAFFAITREGLETVIFLIGMAGKMPATSLVGGIVAGFGLLAVVAFAIIKGGNRLPIRPVFLVSSLIVFYLCFKFMGSGIHSLQMAGIVPSTVDDYLPERASFSLYPSWYSTLPQLLFVMAGLSVIVLQRVRHTAQKYK
ncbi:FTR1 family iron permease [Cohnella panacarvi]|uniref:FTR1 family iron permease n=1 Tax=Cohnella panacarvi TaxID=400776 RepID=UPI000478CD80|nr:FTR1 family protein [Cohnella panacarvi]